MTEIKQPLKYGIKYHLKQRLFILFSFLFFYTFIRSRVYFLNFISFYFYRVQIIIKKKVKIKKELKMSVIKWISSETGFSF